MKKFPFDLGFKLPLDWRELQRRGTLPSFDGNVYLLLHHIGFDYIEFSTGSCQSDEEISLLRHEADACRENGLRVALHPYLVGLSNSAFFDIEEDCSAALQCIIHAALITAVSGKPVSVVLHPAEYSYGAAESDMDAARCMLLTRSKAFFAEIERKANEFHPKVQPLVEHQVPPAAGQRLIRIGDTYEELLDVVADTSLKLCWDTGHYILSTERYGQSKQPPDRFLERVGAVHLHNVVDGRDHQPITEHSHQLKEYIRMLQSNNFNGSLTLEYSMEGITSRGKVLEVLEDSVDILFRWMV